MLIVDDQALVRAGFRMILEAEEDMEVVGEAADGRAAVEEARRLRPDVVLMDVRMPELDGIEATRHAARTGRREHEGRDADDVRHGRVRLRGAPRRRERLPAQGRSSEQLVEGIRAVASGDALLAPSITRRVIEEFVSASAWHARARCRPSWKS